MKNNPTVSIALCTYNGERFLKEQLESLVNQTYSNIEIVIVDDASQDHTISILNEYIEKYPFISIYKNQTNIGLQLNFQKALSLCKGEYICISDQDDIWDLNKIQLMINKIGKNILIYHDSELVDENGKSINIKMSEKLNFVRGSSKEAFYLMNCVSGHSVFFKKELLNYALPFPNKGIYDHWLALVATHFGTIDFIDKCLVKYRQHEHNCTDIQGIKRKKDKNKKLRLKRRLKNENDWLKICAQLQVKQKGTENLAIHLFTKAKKRTSNYFNIRLGYQIWKNRHTLLSILKYNDWGKFSFALRHVWGWKLKSIFKT